MGYLNREQGIADTPYRSASGYRYRECICLVRGKPTCDHWYKRRDTDYLCGRSLPGREICRAWWLYECFNSPVLVNRAIHFLVK